MLVTRECEVTRNLVLFTRGGHKVGKITQLRACVFIFWLDFCYWQIFQNDMITAHRSVELLIMKIDSDGRQRWRVVMNPVFNISNRSYRWIFSSAIAIAYIVQHLT